MLLHQRFKPLLQIHTCTRTHCGTKYGWGWFLLCVWWKVFGWLWGMWGLNSGQDEICSNTKYDVSPKG